MCIILFAVNEHEHYPFILAANRDEYYSRPASSADYWTQHPTILAGRDLQAGGTWLGISTSGSFCAVTNHYRRDERARNASLLSRGNLVTSFLTSNAGIEDYSSVLRSTKDQYNGYGILFGDFSKLRYQSNMSDVHTDVDHGVHGLSNHFLNSPWPRVEHGIQSLRELLKLDAPWTVDCLFAILRQGAQEDPLRNLGKANGTTPLPPWEMPVFIRSKNFGTRSSTVIMADRSGCVCFEERVFNPKLNAYEEGRKFQLKV